MFRARESEANAFYASITDEGVDADHARTARQGYAGLLHSRQSFHFVTQEWLDGDPAQPPPPPERRKRPSASATATSWRACSTSCS